MLEQSNTTNSSTDAAPTVYTDNGYKDRSDYLSSLADGVSNSEAVYAIADILGENEDFDGLVSAMEDFEDML